MPNSTLQNKTYPVPTHLQRFLGASISYPNLKMTITRLNQAKDAQKIGEFNAKGGDLALTWAQDTLKTDRNTLKTKKTAGMRAGRENQFIRPHEKDKDNANPTKVGGLPKMQKGSINRKLTANKEVYNESLEGEIETIKYLMEYMNNKKPKL